MESTECIDPRVGEWFPSLMEDSVEQDVGDWAFEPSVAREARVHWYSCPACRAAFPKAVEVIDSLKPAIEAMVREALLKKRNETLDEINLCSATTKDRGECFAEKLSVLAASAQDVQWALFYISEDLTDFTVRSDSYDESSQRVPLSKYAGFITSLDHQLQTFVFESILCDELFWTLRWKFIRMTIPGFLSGDPADPSQRCYELNEEYVGEVEDCDAFIRARLTNAIASSEFALDVLFSALQSAASDYQRQLADSIGATLSSAAGGPQEHLNRPVLPDRIALQDLRSEMADSFDSLKAGQMELRRLIDSSGRSAAAFEDEIEVRLGNVYPRLHWKTQQLLQKAEYLYSLNKAEPDYFHGPVLIMSQAYENELLIRIIWPYLRGLLERGTDTYDCDGRSLKPLIFRGKVLDRNLNLGSISWHLKFDQPLREWVKKGRFPFAEVISEDVDWITGIRNGAAHQPICSRAVADEVRGRILQSDGILGHLHVHADGEELRKPEQY